MLSAVLLKNPNFQGGWELQGDLEKFWKKLGDVLVQVHNFSAPRVFEML